MSDPLYAQSQKEKSGSLWERAPTWRNLTAAASVLTIAALALPIVVPQPAQPPSRLGAPYPAVAAKLAAATIAPQASAPTPAAPAASSAHAAPTHTASIPPAAALPANPVANPALESPQQACTIQMANSPTPMSGTVIGFIPHDQSVNIFRNTGLNSGGVVNPSFLDDMRVMVRPDPGTNGGSHNPVVPAGITVHVGDHVTYQTPYRDPSMRCGFFPSQVTADQGPAAAPAPQGQNPTGAQLVSLPPAAPVTAPNPIPAPATQSNVCPMVMPPSPIAFGNGVVMSFDDRAMSMARIQFTQAQTHGQIDPNYIDNQRVIVRLGSGELRVFLVPKTMQVHPGDRVTFQGIYRNMNLPCNYVPNLITADTGPAPQNTATGPAAPVQPPAH
jgi:hypothetical protein